MIPQEGFGTAVTLKPLTKLEINQLSAASGYVSVYMQVPERAI